jgi:MarR family transcriptional regulator for hemolysin
MRPATPPIGLALASAARTVSRAFDDALEQAGGSLPIWLVLLNLKIKPNGSQRELAAAVGVREATLTHHLNAMERAGLLSRRRDPDNRRVHVVELSDAGEAMFVSLREVALGFDKRLRRGITADQTRALADLLGRLAANVDGAGSAQSPWQGLAEQQPRRAHS